MAERRPLSLTVAFWAILLLASGLRLAAYGDPRLSVATLDTSSYVESSRAPLLSWQSLAGQRLFTTNVVFKLVPGGPECAHYRVSMPAVGKEAKRQVQACFTPIALLQAMLSLGSWIWLAIVIARHLTTRAMSLLAAALVTLFGFSPQIAAWDSVIGSESLSLSLFALSTAVLFEAVFVLADSGGQDKTRLRWALALWFAVFALWVFTKDASLFVVLPTLLLLAPVLACAGKPAQRAALASTIALIGLLILGLTTAARSQRWQTPLRGAYDSFVLPYPERARFMTQGFDMPDPGSPAFDRWFRDTSRSAYAAFILLHPGFIVTSVLSDAAVFTYSYQQPYFQLTGEAPTSMLEFLGGLLHPGSAVFYVVDTIAVVAFSTVALRTRRPRTIAWAWILIWLYLAGVVTLFVTYFADAQGVMRHIFPSLEMFRLLMWLSLLVLVDSLLGPSHANHQELPGS